MPRPPLYWLDFFFALPFEIGLDQGTIKRPEVDFDAPGLGRIPGWEDVTINPETGVPEYPEPGVWPSTTYVYRRRTTKARHPVWDTWDAFGDDLRSELTRAERAKLKIRSLRHRLQPNYIEAHTMIRLVSARRFATRSAAYLRVDQRPVRARSSTPKRGPNPAQRGRPRPGYWSGSFATAPTVDCRLSNGHRESASR
jgi:hypothetical protein